MAEELKDHPALGAEMKVTKCITIHTFEPENLTESSSSLEKWVNCFSLASPTQQALNTKSDLESANLSHMLLRITVPNQQPYHLPMLVTPVLCVYLITFDLRYQKESLGRIHSVMKNVYTLSTCHSETGSTERLPKVLLVGMHADKVEAEDRGLFTQELNRRLEKMPYNRLVERGGDEPFWAVDGGDLCLSDTHPLSQHIKSYGCRHEVEVHQWIVRHCELEEKLQEKIRDVPCICYRDLKDEVAHMSSDATSNFDAFVHFLHNYGFIFYHSVEEGEESEKVVLLRPQYLCNLFAKVQELSKGKKEFTIGDLLSRTAASIKASAQHKQWFRRICIDLGLVVALRSDYVFLMALEGGPPSSPSYDEYSVPPLLMTFRDSNHFIVEPEYLLPSYFFAVFVTEFLEALTNPQSRPPKIVVMEQHYMQVMKETTSIHVVEHDFCIEIGIQQLDVGVGLTDEMKMKNLLAFCREVKNSVCKSAEIITRRLKLAPSSIRYGFYHSCTTEEGPLNSFGEFCFLPAEKGGPYLECFCCDVGVQPTTLLQKVWFLEDIPLKEVSITVSPNGRKKIRKLQVVPQVSDTPSGSDQTDGQSNIPSNPPCAPNGATAQPKQKELDVPVDQVLDHFRDRFLKEMDASDVVFDLKNKGIIPDGVLKAVNRETSATRQNQFLHAHLERTSTKESLLTVCEVIIAVPGNPRMRALGEDMKRKLEGSSEGATS